MYSTYLPPTPPTHLLRLTAFATRQEAVFRGKILSVSESAFSTNTRSLPSSNCFGFATALKESVFIDAFTLLHRYLSGKQVCNAQVGCLLSEGDRGGGQDVGIDIFNIRKSEKIF